MSRPTNESIGKPLRSERLAIQLTEDEKAELEAAAASAGAATSTWARLTLLEAARKLAAREE